ncbi:MAG: phytanoyl-CoA dioxygenase family protein [Pseudomonadota bacterium]
MTSAEHQIADLALTVTQRAAFKRDGFLVVRGLLTKPLVQLLLARFEALFAGQYQTGVMPDEVNWRAGRDPNDVTRQICNAWKADPVIARVVLNATIGRFCAQLGGWPGARINQDNLFWKPPGGKAIGFHQDSAYEDWVVPSDMVSCWMALDDTSAEGGSVTYMRGSHRWPRVEDRVEFHAPDKPQAALIEAAKAAGIDDPVGEPLVVNAGDAAFHHGWLWHGSETNRSERPRRSLVAHCMSADARFHESNTNPVYSRYKRPDDVVMDEAFFPITWVSEDAQG